MANVRVPSDQELRRITTRAVAEIVPEQEFVAALRSGRRLRLKMGFDPTRPLITLGWAVGLRKLRQLQELGHTAVIIIGDWTARIGDPSGESLTRQMLSEQEVKANSEAVLGQFYKILDPERTEVRHQSEWFDGFSLTDVVRLAARFTVAQMLERDDFAQRFAAHKPIGLHELLYPLLQGYDSIAVEADVEFGGTDQKFNILLGRELQGALGQPGGAQTGPRPGAGRPQSAFLVPLLVGLDGVQKMSQSLGNYIAIDDPPHDMYGKVMSIADQLMLEYFALLTDVPEEELSGIRESIEKRTVNPMEHKMRLAREIVAQFHSVAAAREAEEEFVRVFRRRELPEAPEQVAWRTLPFVDALLVDRVSLGEVQRKGFPIKLATFLMDIAAAPSLSEARRLIQQRAVEVDGKVVTGVTANVRIGSAIRVGKHRFLRIVDADKQSQGRSTD